MRKSRHLYYGNFTSNVINNISKSNKNIVGIMFQVAVVIKKRTE